ncbi:hypothetical protein BTN49_2639 [Candidatus Enterovibrio escicola]|uniref:Uncharacterized protein n=1 Tax=Candidatus Enterovibrio escicola TaxID=1927127 RepID=A0A2A5T0Z6_9GAMM|nr:hypothetical protein BTN49_2639 [Candidatus Enterovibrio escacola]
MKWHDVVHAGSLVDHLVEVNMIVADKGFDSTSFREGCKT